MFNVERSSSVSLVRVLHVSVRDNFKNHHSTVILSMTPLAFFGRISVEIIYQVASCDILGLADLARLWGASKVSDQSPFRM